MSESKVSELIQQLKSEDETDRRYAIEDLSDLGDPSCVGELVQLLFDESAGVREAVVDALRKFDPSSTAEKLIPVVASENVPARNAALDCLANTGPMVYPVIEEKLLKVDSTDLKKFGLDLIIRIGNLDADAHRSLLTTVERLLQDPNDNVAGAALEVLALKPGLTQPQNLISLLGRSSWIDANALIALQKLGHHDLLAGLAEPTDTRLNAGAKILVKRLLRAA